MPAKKIEPEDRQSVVKRGETALNELGLSVTTNADHVRLFRVDRALRAFDEENGEIKLRLDEQGNDIDYVFERFEVDLKPEEARTALQRECLTTEEMKEHGLRVPQNMRRRGSGLVWAFYVGTALNRQRFYGHTPTEALKRAREALEKGITP
jgi:hypothetical protein